MANYKICSAFIFSVVLAGTTFADTNNSGGDSFAHIESLDRNIEEAGKEITALQMTHQLKTLQQQAQKMNLDFVVLRIQGIDSNLTATFQFDNHTVTDYSSGDIIENRYQINRITANSVELYDQQEKKVIPAPFY